jgi:hypothetical protein
MPRRPRRSPNVRNTGVPSLLPSRLLKATMCAALVAGALCFGFVSNLAAATFVDSNRDLGVLRPGPERLAAASFGPATGHVESFMPPVLPPRAVNDTPTNVRHEPWDEAIRELTGEEQQRRVATEAVDEAKRREQEREEEEEEAQQRAVAERIEEEQRLHEAELGADDAAPGCAVELTTKEEDQRRVEEAAATAARLYDVPERVAQEGQAPIDVEAAAETAPQCEAEPVEKKETQWHKAAVEAMRQLTVKAAQPRLAAIAAADAATHRELELAHMRKQRAADEAVARAVQSMQQQQQQQQATAVIRAWEAQQRTAAAEALDKAKRREQEREEEAQQRAVADRIEEEQRLHEAELGADDAAQGCAVELVTKEEEQRRAEEERLYDVPERAAEVEQAPTAAEAAADTAPQSEAEPAATDEEPRNDTKQHEAGVEEQQQRMAAPVKDVTDPAPFFSSFLGRVQALSFTVAQLAVGTVIGGRRLMM